MPEITEADLRKQIEKAELDTLYVLHGEEKYLVRSYANKLIGKAAGKSFTDFNLQRFDGDAPADEIAAAVEALPFMAERKCVAVSDLNLEARSAQEISKLNELIAGIPETTVLVIYLPSVEIDYRKSAKWKAFLKAAAKYGSSVQLKLREGAELEKLLCSMASKRGCELSRQDAARLVSMCGKGLEQLSHELDKLCAYVGGSGVITKKEIDLLTPRSLETTVFSLARALLSGGYDLAYQLLDQLFFQNEEPIMILAALSSSYLDLYRARAAVQSGGSSSGLAAVFPADYKGKEFRLRNAERDGKKLSLETLRESLDILLDTDLALKSSRTSDRILLEKMIARLLLAAERERIR